MHTAERGFFSWLEELAAKEPGMPMLGDADRWFDAQTVLAIVEHLGISLRRMGLASGLYAGFQPKQNAAAAMMMLGLRSAGAVAVLSDPRQSMEESLRNAENGPGLSVCIRQTGATRFSIEWLHEDRPEETLDLYSLRPTDGLRVITGPQDPAFVIFTSGSTGKSKAVVLSEDNLISNLLDSRPLGDYRFADRALGCLPLHHVFGLVLLIGTAVLGYGIYFTDKKDVLCLLSAIEEQKLTRMNGVPSLYLAMAEHRDRYDLSSMRAGFIGGGPITCEQFTAAEESLHMTLIPVYGMSECIGISCASWQDSRESRAGGVGRFYPMNTGKILLDDGTEAGPMEEGQICVTGPMRMLGYFGSAMPPEELLHTGDLGYVDRDGILHLTGRKKDIIIRCGNNLSARKIEQALLKIPGVRDAAVVAIPDPQEGEVPAAMVVAENSTLSQAPDLCKNELPVFCHFADRLPLTASGKPDKQTIREVLLRCRPS